MGLPRSLVHSFGVFAAVAAGLAACNQTDDPGFDTASAAEKAGEVGTARFTPASMTQDDPRMPSPFRPGDVVMLDNNGWTAMIVSCAVKAGVSMCSVRMGTNGSYGNGEGDMWVSELVQKDAASRRAAGLPARGSTTPPAVVGPTAPPGRRDPGPTVRTPPVQSPVVQGQGAMGGRCAPGMPYTGAVDAGRRASAQTFQEVIINLFTNDGTPNYPRNVQFLRFSLGPVVANRAGMTNQGANLVNNGAPQGVSMHTINLSMVVCKEEWTHKQRYDSTYFCWADGGEWECGVADSRMTSVPY